MQDIEWVENPAYWSNSVGPRILWKTYLLRQNYYEDVFRTLDKFLDDSLQKMQLKCDKCNMPYSLEDIVCNDCGSEKSLRIEHKLVDDKLAGRVRINCGSCRKSYYLPSERVATCDKHPNNNLSYFLTGNEQTELLTITCLAAADEEIRSSTEYLQAICSAESSVSEALRWMSAPHIDLLKERRLNFNAKDIRDPNIYVITAKGKGWLRERMELFKENGFDDMFKAFIADREKQLYNIQIKDDDGLRRYIASKQDFKIRNLSKKTRDFIRKEGFYYSVRDGIIRQIDENQLPPKLLELLKEEYERFKQQKEKSISARYGAVVYYNVPIIVKEGTEDMKIRHIPSCYLPQIFDKDKQEALQR